jgi:hypothetical protein
LVDFFVIILFNVQFIVISINIRAEIIMRKYLLNHIFQNTLDEIGCKLGCSVMSDVSQDNHFVIGRDDVSILLVNPTCMYLLKKNEY